MVTITAKELEGMGYSRNTSQNIIREAKQIMVTKGFVLYNNRRLGRVPIHVVESILGVTLSKSEVI